jgi:hypothetical protein
MCRSETLDRPTHTGSRADHSCHALSCLCRYGPAGSWNPVAYAALLALECNMNMMWVFCVAGSIIYFHAHCYWQSWGDKPVLILSLQKVSSVVLPASSCYHVLLSVHTGVTAGTGSPCGSRLFRAGVSASPLVPPTPRPTTSTTWIHAATGPSTLHGTWGPALGGSDQLFIVPLWSNKKASSCSVAPTELTPLLWSSWD